MCKIICNITYKCGHTEPWVTRRTCQYNSNGTPKSPAKEPLCLLYTHCWEFGRVRQVNIADRLLCSACFIAKTKDREDLSEELRTARIDGAEKDAAFHAGKARDFIAEANGRAQLEHLPTEYIKRVSNVALKRLDIAFSDEQMKEHHFAELLQIIVGLPFLDKDRLIEKFAGKIEEKFGPKKVKEFYELSMKYRNFGDEFRKGLKAPGVLDKAQKAKK
ncbi:hypothetical protein O1611_g3779 [Lasiodiplodia mahajangana]|uniref:Uncharacterized protein n=1 Tax=Lasiodiplodia mahajangana TaxID=1108764 RepID=A0ACC2JQV2_9PEZI|nr:hypothetical protein O1611_g3779 [Lasiodiplodia mahajangana]